MWHKVLPVDMHKAVLFKWSKCGLHFLCIVGIFSSLLFVFMDSYLHWGLDLWHTEFCPTSMCRTGVWNKTYFVLIIVCVHWRTGGFTLILGNDSRILVTAYHHRMLWLTWFLLGPVIWSGDPHFLHLECYMVFFSSEMWNMSYNSCFDDIRHCHLTGIKLC